MNSTFIGFRLILVVCIDTSLTALEMGDLPLIGIGLVSHTLWIGNLMREFHLEKVSC